METELIIIGASGHGKVVADLAEKCGYVVKGFLDDNPEIGEHFGYPVLGEVRQAERIVERTPNCQFVIAIGNNQIRRKIAQIYKVHWAILIHPRAVVARGVTIGGGNGCHGKCGCKSRYGNRKTLYCKYCGGGRA